MAHGFLLLRFPLLVIQDVLSHMNPHEIMTLAQIPSSTTRGILKQCTRQWGCEVDLSIMGYLSFSISWKDDVFDFRISIHQENHGYIKTRKTGTGSFHHEMYFYGDDKLETYRELIELAKECMNAEITSLFFRLDKFPEKIKEITDWVKSQSSPITCVCVWRESEVKSKDVAYVFEQLHRGALSLWIETEEDLLIPVPKEEMRRALSC